jgi:CheY-like chemotaxis protein
MFKVQEDTIAVLGVCTDAPASPTQTAGLDFHSVHNGRRAIDMLRMLSFDFLLVGLKLPDMTTWDLLRHLKTAWPQQKWALVGGPITNQQEITARMFGATTIFDTTPSTTELFNMTARIREKAVQEVLSGRFDKQLAPVRRVRSAAM